MLGELSPCGILIKTYFSIKTFNFRLNWLFNYYYNFDIELIIIFLSIFYILSF